MVPFQVNLIPLYRIMATLHWIDTYLALIVPNLTSVFGIFLMRQFLMTIPNDLLDAARIDGCNEFGVFTKIVLPLSLPGIATLIILTFMGTWNDFLWPRIVTSSEALFTLPVGLAQLQMKNTSNVAQIMAGTVLTALPMIIVFLFMQRQFIEGMTAGASERMIGAVDIGGTKIAVGMVDESGRLLARLESTHPHAEARPYDGLELIIEMLRQTASQAGGQLRGIGIGCTGPVNPLTGIVGRMNFCPAGKVCNLAAEMEQLFGLKVALENDADAAALGEFAWGAGQRAHTLPIRNSQHWHWGGIVFDGQLYRGVDGAHPEIGHHVIDPSGPQCFCGAHGCWESLASGLALARFANRPTATAACEAAEGGDPQAIQAVAGEAKYLGLGIANLVSLYTPDIITLGGGVMQSRHLFWEKIEQTVRENCGLVPFELTRLVPARLGRDVGLAGAAQAWIGRFG